MKLDKLISVDILVNGRTVKITSHEGKKYIEARDGSEYELLITNDSNKRVLVIPSVDSLNVLSGKEATSNDSGYIIDRYSNIKIKGFRVSNEKVAAFTFGQKSNSYVKNVTGSSKNAGVIGIKAYFEYQEPTYILNTNVQPNWYYPTNPLEPQWDTIKYTCSNNSFESGLKSRSSSNFKGIGGQSVNYCSTTVTDMAQDDAFNLGTEFGKAKISKVTTVDFKRGIFAGQIEIYYSTRQSLLNMGIPLDRVDKISYPKAFKNDYCKPPSGWRDNG